MSESGQDVAGLKQLHMWTERQWYHVCTKPGSPFNFEASEEVLVHWEATLAVVLGGNSPAKPELATMGYSVASCLISGFDEACKGILSPVSVVGGG